MTDSNIFGEYHFVKLRPSTYKYPTTCYVLATQILRQDIGQIFVDIILDI